MLSKQSEAAGLYATDNARDGITAVMLVDHRGTAQLAGTVPSAFYAWLEARGYTAVLDGWMAEYAEQRPALSAIVGNGPRKAERSTAKLRVIQGGRR